MGFTLREILGDKAEKIEFVSQCPTGKVPYPTKAAADNALRGLSRRQTKMRRFKCVFCDQYHLGHRRGTF